MVIRALLGKINGNLFLIPEERFDSLTSDKGYWASFGYLLFFMALSLPISFLLVRINVMSTFAGLFAVALQGALILLGALLSPILPNEYAPLYSQLTNGILASQLLIGAVFIFIIFYVWFGILHLLLKLIGGKADYLKTVQVCIYGITPWFVSNWLPLPYLNPLLGVVAWFISLVNIVRGVKRVHRISLPKAVVALLLSFVMFSMLVAIVIAIGAAWVFSQGACFGGNCGLY